MFTFDQVKELMDLVAERGLEALEVERAGYRLRIAGRASGVAAAAAPQSALTVSAAPPAVEVAAESALAAAEPAASDAGAHADAHVLHSPIVGTFYVAPSPDADPYVRVGDRVKRGQIVCIVEAMKLMNEIEADVDGTIRAVFPENGQPVEYGEPLFAIEVA